ncbi:hypothetical protein D3C80_725890 [compost metagenome]
MSGREGFRTLPDLDVDFLERLFGIAAIFQDTQTYAHQFWACRPVKRDEGSAVSHRDTIDQTFDVVALH